MATVTKFDANGNPLPMSTGGSDQGSAPTSAPTPKPASSGRFVNLNRYLAAAAPGASGALSGKIQKTVEKETRAVGDIASQAEGIRSQLDAEKERIGKASGFVQQIGQDPTQITDYESFNKLRDAQSQVSDWRKQTEDKFIAAQNQLKNARDIAQATGTEAGRFGLLQQAVNRPTYTRGQQRLDQLLLQTADRGNFLKNLQKQTQASVASGEQALLGSEKIMSEFDPLQQSVKKAQQDIRSALGGFGMQDDPTTPDVDESKGSGAFGALQQSLRDRLTGVKDNPDTPEDETKLGYLQQQDALQDAWNKIVSRQEFDPNLLAKAGLTQGQRLYGLNLNDIKTSWNRDAVTEQQMADESDRARYSALAKLAGVGETYLNPTNVGEPTGFSIDEGSAKAFADRLRSTEAAFAADAKKYGKSKAEGLSWLQDSGNVFDAVTDMSPEAYKRLLGYDPIKPGSMGSLMAEDLYKQSIEQKRQQIQSAAKQYGISDLLNYKPVGKTDQERAADFANKIESMRGGIEKALTSNTGANPFAVQSTGAYGEQLQRLLNIADAYKGYNLNDRLSVPKPVNKK